MAHFHNPSILGSSGNQNLQYKISRSLRFNSADSAYLNRTPGSAGNQKTYTLSMWIKRSTLGAKYFFGSYFSNLSRYQYLGFNSSDQLELFGGTYTTGGSTTTNVNLSTTAVYRDVSAWYHIVLAVDTTQATNTNRVKLYVNGTQVTAFGTATYPAQNTESYINSVQAHYLGDWGGGGGLYLDGYLADVYFLDGTATTPSTFAETDAITGQWVPKTPTGISYGTNGFRLPFSDNSGTTATTLGKDAAGSNNWTPNNLSVTAGAGNDSLIDTPTPYADGGNGRGNYCTLNPLDATLTLSNGNLDWSAPSSVERGARGTFAVSSGKWYFEYIAKGQTFELVGWAAQTQNNNSTMPTGVGASTWAYYLFDLKTYNNATASAVYGTAASSGDIIMVALDLDNSKIYWGRNGTWFNSGNPATGTNAAYTNVSGTLFPWVQQYNQTSSINFGQRPFAYTPPSGFVALNTQNLPEPSIKKPSAYMDVKLYSGTNASQSITGLGFSPDLIWFKNRTGTAFHGLFDSVRGRAAGLSSNVSDAESTSSAGNDLVSFDANGFTLGPVQNWNSTNGSGNSIVAWCWDESATPGFDIVTYTGDGVTSRTVSHSLGVTPAFIVIKQRNSTSDWEAWHKSLGSGLGLRLNSTSGQITLSSTSGGGISSSPTSSVFSFTSGTAGVNNVNANTATYVAYLWSEVAGFSKFGSYTGNGSSDGPFVFCGFRPRWVMIKRTDGAGSWFMIDTARGSYNVVNPYVMANVSNAEATDLSWDILSNGFKLRSSYTDINTSSGTYVFAAFSESAFKYSLAR
jgi:hypothetical protein